MMSETPQAVVRVTFLLVVTVLFAAIWQGDHAPGPRFAKTSRDGAPASAPEWQPPSIADGSDLPAGESDEMVLRHAESDIDRNTWEQADSLPPWTARGADLPNGESATMMHRHAESEVDRDDWERAGSRPPWSAPGTDLPHGESEYMARGDDREASTSVNKVRSRTLSSRPESHLALAFAQPDAQKSLDTARRDLPAGITTGTYQVVDNAGRTTRVTLTPDDLAGLAATSPRPLYQSVPAPGQRVYWIRIEPSGSSKKVAANRVTIRRSDLSNATPPTMASSAALLTGSLDRTTPESVSTTGWLDHASRWMANALDLVRAVPDDQAAGVRR